MSDDENGAEDDVTVETLGERLETLEADLDDAETEADLDAIEADLDALEADLEAADLPEADEDDEEDPVAELESDLESFESDLEDARGPYAADVVDTFEAARTEIENTRWTDTGKADLLEAVRDALENVNAALGTSLSLADREELTTRLLATIEEIETAIERESLDPDADRETIADLIAAADALEAGVEDAQTWDDLSVRQQLEAQGFYDVLDHVKDYPPELHALKVHRKRGNVEMILLGLETFESDFMEEHCLEFLEIMGPEEALEPMLERAGRRDNDAITILGKIGIPDEEVVEALLEYVDADSDPLLQKDTFRALGEMGADDAVQPLANQLLAENAEIRSAAARALGLIGDTRAIDPLADVLADDEDDTARASAAWALNRIGTEEALESLSAYADDRAYLVQAEAEKAA